MTRDHTEAPATTVADVLRGYRGALTRQGRVIATGQSLRRLDHVLTSTGGTYLIQERRSATRDNLDDTRRSAETLESAITRPVDPVLVVRDEQPFSGARTERGVRVVHHDGFADWLSGLPVGLADKAEMVLIDARVEKATRADRRRLPEWEVTQRLLTDGVVDPRPQEAPQPEYPRSWSAAEPGLRSSSRPARAGRSGRRRAPVGSRMFAWARGPRLVAAFFALVVVGALALTLI